MLLARFSRRCFVERPTRTENLVVVIRVQIAPARDVCPREGAPSDAAAVLLYAIVGWWASNRGVAQMCDYSLHGSLSSRSIVLHRRKIGTGPPAQQEVNAMVEKAERVRSFIVDSAM